MLTHKLKFKLENIDSINDLEHEQQLIFEMI